MVTGRLSLKIRRTLKAFGTGDQWNRQASAERIPDVWDAGNEAREAPSSAASPSEKCAKSGNAKIEGINGLNSQRGEVEVLVWNYQEEGVAGPSARELEYCGMPETAKKRLRRRWKRFVSNRETAMLTRHGRRLGRPEKPSGNTSS